MAIRKTAVIKWRTAAASLLLFALYLARPYVQGSVWIGHDGIGAWKIFEWSQADKWGLLLWCVFLRVYIVNPLRCAESREIDWEPSTYGGVPLNSSYHTRRVIWLNLDVILDFSSSCYVVTARVYTQRLQLYLFLVIFIGWILDILELKTKVKIPFDNFLGRALEVLFVKHWHNGFWSVCEMHWMSVKVVLMISVDVFSFQDFWRLLALLVL